MRKSSIKSWNCPCISPQTVTGHFCSNRSVGWAGRTTTRPRNDIPLAAHWIPPAIPLLPGRHRNEQTRTHHYQSVKTRNPPDRTAAARPPPLIACKSSNSRSSRPESVWTRGRLLATGGVARGTAQYRSPCCYPLRRYAQLAEKEGPAGEGRSREKTTEFVDGRGYRGDWKICGIITLQMEIQLKDNFPRLIQGIRGWDLETREREKRWEFGKVKLRVVNRCATLQPHTAFSKVAYVIINYTIV